MAREDVTRRFRRLYRGGRDPLADRSRRPITGAVLWRPQGSEIEVLEIGKRGFVMAGEAGSEAHRPDAAEVGARQAEPRHPHV